MPAAKPKPKPIAKHRDKPNTRFAVARKYRPYATLTPEENEWADHFEERYLTARDTRMPNGELPTKQKRLPNSLALSWLHPNYNPDLPGKVCICCEKQVPNNNRFMRDDEREDHFTDICLACIDRYVNLVSPAYAKKLYDEHKAGETRRKAEELKAKTAVGEMALRELAQRRLAKEHLLPFIQRFNDKYSAGWVHKAICKRLEKFSRDVAAKKSPRLMIFMPPRAGKLCADSTPVLTTAGWRTHGELKPGDYVFHPSGEPTRVEAVSGPDMASVEVEFTNGEVVKVHPNHEWTVYDRGYRTWKTVETRFFYEQTKFKKTRQVWSSGRAIYQVPGTNALRFPEATLPVAPYTFGAWLGDGSAGKPCLTHAPQETEVVAQINAQGYATTAVCTHSGTGVLTTHFSGPKPGVAGALTRGLQASGAYTEKHIPDEYKRSSVEQRLALLAGLIDTDGHVDKQHRVQISTGSARLADDIVEVVRSLGWRSTHTVAPPILSTSGIQGKRDIHVVSFNPDIGIPTKLPRKAIVAPSPAQRRIGIRAVRPAAPEKGRCIQVAAADGLYLVGRRLVATHNSEIASKTFPAWHLGHHPEHEIIASSYAVSLPMGFSRKVKDLIQTETYRKIFPFTALNKNAQAAEAWLTTKGGGYVAAGVGTGITGKGAHIAIIDDPVKDSEEADSETQRQKVWDWYSSTLYTRLAPGGGVLCIQCMTGDTMVLRPDGAETRLDEIRPGDEVATYDDGKLASARVLNWASQGYDDIYTMTTSSGKAVKANARHPFLVETKEGLEWIRLKDLKSGQRIVTVKDSGVSGKGRLAQPMSATSQSAVVASAPLTITRRSGLLGIARRLLGKTRRLVYRLSSSIDTALPSRTTIVSWLNKAVGAPSALLCPSRQVTQPTGPTSYALITTTTGASSGDCYVTSATSSSRSGTPRKSFRPLSTISDFMAEEIISIEPAGCAEVFDIEVERTENFIGNSIACSNTRWHDDDLSGRLIRRQKEREKQLTEEIEQIEAELEDAPEAAKPGLRAELVALREEFEHIERWDVLVFPQEATHDEYYHARNDVFLDEPMSGATKIRSKGDPLHEARFNRRMIIRMKQTMEPRHWSALHQQNPVPEEGEIFTKSMFRYEPVVHEWRRSDVYIAGDLALGSKQSNDWSVLLVGAMDYEGLLHIIDMARFKGGAVPIEENLIALLRRYEKRMALFGLEQGQIQMALWPAILKRLRDEKLSVPFTEGKQALKPISDKVARARTAQSMMQQGRIIFPSNQPWVEDVKIELLRFPGGLNDDIVDALAWLAKMTVKAQPPKERKPKGFKSWKDKLTGYSGKPHGHMNA